MGLAYFLDNVLTTCLDDSSQMSECGRDVHTEKLAWVDYFFAGVKLECEGRACETLCYSYSDQGFGGALQVVGERWGSLANLTAGLAETRAAHGKPLQRRPLAPCMWQRL